MKSVVFLSVISLLMFASCSNEDNVDPVESENGSVTFELSAVNEIESGSVTRAPVYSQEATQHVFGTYIKTIITTAHRQCDVS